jgi:hypothetical protein
MTKAMNLQRERVVELGEDVEAEERLGRKDGECDVYGPWRALLLCLSFLALAVSFRMATVDKEDCNSTKSAFKGLA